MSNQDFREGQCLQMSVWIVMNALYAFNSMNEEMKLCNRLPHHTEMGGTNCLGSQVITGPGVT